MSHDSRRHGLAGPHSLSLPRLTRLFGVLIVALAIVAACGSVLGSTPAHAADTFPKLEKCEKGVKNPDGSTRSYEDYALCMAAQIDEAIASYKAGKYDQAYDEVNAAYYDWYENNLEPPSMTLPGNRKVKLEGKFTRAKLALKSDAEGSDLDAKLTDIKISVARDAMVLDGVADANSPDSVGAQLLKQGKSGDTDESARNWVDFVTAMTLLLREGLEALLVVVAIVLYLVQSGNKALAKHVYLGALAAIVCSFLLAWIMKLAVGGASQASELIEGITMFIAVAMLFYVSNWMLSKTSGENWSHYIQGMVKTSVSSGAAKTLIFAAFIAVLREGAELVLFYTASFAGGGHSNWWIAGGLLAGVAILAVIFVIFRFGGAKLPIRPIFMATSILLFVMCISFVGKGVQELKEAGIILGTTNLPWIRHYIPDLGIYPQAETLLPQLILLIAAVWIIWANVNKTRRYKRSLKQGD
ncbi:MAG: FTR1 family protein [Actinomycetaceae bacterium]|nr:FTR1 family protein [Actinomycetaceae bacterium]MDU0970107.1 FTR1 family protein [Actinomycetaceae bacterium]